MVDNAEPSKVYGYLEDGRPIKTGSHVVVFTVEEGRLVICAYGKEQCIAVALDTLGAQEIRDLIDEFLLEEWERDENSDSG